MRSLLFLLVVLSGRSLLAQIASPPPPIESSFDLRHFLVGTTWTWSPRSDGSDASEITFTSDGKVKHEAFIATFSVLSKTEVELRWTGKVAKLHFDPATHLKYTGEDFGGERPLYGALRPPGSGTSARELTAAAFAGAAPAAAPTAQTTTATATPAKAPVSDPAIASDLNTLVEQHAAAVAAAAAPFDAKFQADHAALLQRSATAEDTAMAHQHAARVAVAVIPINKKYQIDLAPLLKRADQAGDTAMSLKLKSMIAALGANLDGTNWKQDGNHWAHAFFFDRGMLHIEIGGHPSARVGPYQMNSDGFATFSYDGNKQELAISPDRTWLKWGTLRYSPQ